MKQIKDLPPSVMMKLDDDGGIEYPVDGDYVVSYEIELVCFSRKTFLKTWPLRQRVMRATTTLINDFADVFNDNAQPAEVEDGPVDVNAFKNMLLMCGFDGVAAMEEFKQFAVAGGLIKVTEDVTMCKARWAQVDDVTKEQILFTYLANFIQPCVV